MSRHMITVCIFCFVCATHSPCASHAAIRRENISVYKEHYPPHVPPLTDPLSNRRAKPDPNLSPTDEVRGDRRLEKRNSDSSDSGDSKEYVQKLFRMFGDGDTMTADGFQRLMEHLQFDRVHLHEETDHEATSSVATVDEGSFKNETNYTSDKCLTTEQWTAIKNQIPSTETNQTTFYKTCPMILYGLATKRCPSEKHDFEVDNVSSTSPSMAWLYSIAAVILISACGVLALAIIPVMQKWFYKPLIQFLVALAVGTLAGDALLHLLPHAMTAPHYHEHHHSPDDDPHAENTKKGCVAMLGLTFFFITERLILLFGKWRKGKKKHTHSHVTVINDRRASINMKNNTQCMDRYNPFPYCYKDIMNNPNPTYFESNRTAATILDAGSNSDTQSSRKKSCSSPSVEKLEANQNVDGSGDNNVLPEANKMLTPEHKHDEDYTVILREHRNEHHGHSHKHGHVHAAPQNFSSVAWMVIMGDGLHNFTDGMAIGAAFSADLAGGFSTTVAVFCHELPHELGDFAMLLKAGMSIRQALFYNILSSVLCIFGNIFGLFLGNTEYASSWVFAAAAGMFIYIALVDMLPELSSSHEDEGNLIQCTLHLGGLLLGFGIMALIALYEHDLKTIFNDH